MTQNIIVTAIAVLAAVAVVWRVVRANKMASGPTPSCPSCAGYDEKRHGPQARAAAAAKRSA